MVIRRKVVDIGKTADAIVVFFCQNFSVFANISLAVVALNLIGRVRDVLLVVKST